MDTLKETARCQECGVILCPSCHEASLLQSRPNEEICPSCGSVQSMQLLGSLRGMTVNDLMNLRNALKSAAYQPIIILKKAKFLLEQMYHLQKHFWIAPYLEMIDNIPNVVTSVEPFITTYLRDFVSRLRVLLKHVDQDLDLITLSNDISYPNLGFEGALLLIQAEIFMKSISARLKPLRESLDEIESIISIFLQIQEDELQFLRRKFNFHVNELVITYFNNLSIKYRGVRSKKVNLMLTTDRILLFRKEKKGLHLHDVFLREEVLDSRFKKKRFSGTQLEILLSDDHKITVKADSLTLNQIHLTIQHAWTSINTSMNTISNSTMTQRDQIINNLKILHDHLYHYRRYVDQILKGLSRSQQHRTKVVPNLSMGPQSNDASPEKREKHVPTDSTIITSSKQHPRGVDHFRSTSNEGSLVTDFPFFIAQGKNQENYSEQQLNRTMPALSSTSTRPALPPSPNYPQDELISPFQQHSAWHPPMDELLPDNQLQFQRTLPEFFGDARSNVSTANSLENHSRNPASTDFHKLRYLQQRVQDLRLQRDIYSRMLEELKKEKSPLNLRERYELIAEYEKKIKEIDQELDMIFNRVD